jgi:hypothetical protein
MIISLGLTRYIDLILKIALLITAVSVFVPFSPNMPEANLDPSYKFGINQAVAQGLSFGQDIIFTYGPYASIQTKTYHPATDLMMIGGSLYLAISFWLVIIFLMKGVKHGWIVIFCAVIAGVMDFSRDALLFSYPLLVAMTCFKFIEGRILPSNKQLLVIIPLIFAPFGLLPLVKGSMYILCGAISILCFIFFMINKKIIIALLCFFSPLVSMSLFWMIAGQSINKLPNYFITIFPIISGYTEAMAYQGNFLEIIFYLVASAVLLISVSIQKQINKLSKIYLLCILIIFLFLSFKAGFVRHDNHALLSGRCILIVALILPFLFYSKAIIPAIIISLISWFYIDSQYILAPSLQIIKDLSLTYSSAWRGISNRIKDVNWPIQEYYAAVEHLRNEAHFPALDGTTDIYSYNQSYLISSGNSWSPRPIIQSYSVYSPILAEENKKHLLGKRAPKNIFFKVQPIDGRLPSLDDGASWPILLTNYQMTEKVKDFLLLQKKKFINETSELATLTKGNHFFGENVNIPSSYQPIIAQIEIKPTIMGYLANIIFKPSQLHIVIELTNGIQKNYRIITGMVKSDFLISPLIESTDEFLLMYNKPCYLDAKIVKSFSIGLPDEINNLWNKEYEVTFKQFKNKIYNQMKFMSFEGIDEKLLNYDDTLEKCDGSIDMINNLSPVPDNFFASNLLKVSGWVAISASKAILPQEVFIVLIDNQGKHFFLKTHRMLRPDVGEHFKNSQLDASGFCTFADISAFKGQYTLGLAVMHSGKLKICRQFKIQATIQN